MRYGLRVLLEARRPRGDLAGLCLGDCSITESAGGINETLRLKRGGRTDMICRVAKSTQHHVKALSKDVKTQLQANLEKYKT